ncbi:MAG: heme exporter protein CcmD [Methylotenera sp.]|jgi:heme exporter protein D|nr:heme exporter protein CcmD [Methylotenera sp.]
MHWQSFEAFIAMGGYGFYVWTSFGLTALCVVIEIWQLRSRQQKLVLKETA